MTRLRTEHCSILRRLALLACISLINCQPSLGIDSKSTFSAYGGDGAQRMTDRTVCCNRRTIEKGQVIDSSNVVRRTVPVKSRPFDAIPYEDIVCERVAPRKFPSGHIFTRRDFGLPKQEWKIRPDFLYAARDVQTGQVITAADLARAPFEPGKYPQGGLGNGDIIINRIANFDLVKGQTIISGQFGLGPFGDEARRRIRRLAKEKIKTTKSGIR